MAINQFEKILIEDVLSDTIELPVEPAQPLEIIVEDVVAGKNVHIPIANYNDPGIASFSNEDFIVSADGRVEAVSHNPNSLFIRYSAYADGSNFTETWDSSKLYIGLFTGKVAPTEKEAYRWSRFVGGITSVSEVFPDENGNVPLIVFTAPENPQAGQLFFDSEGAQSSEMPFTGETYDNTYNAPLNDDGENDFTAETYGATYELPQNGETLFTSETYGETYTETNSETLFGNGLNENNFGE